MSRRCLLSKYLKGTAAVYNLSLELPRSMRTGSLDIARCGLEDDDLEMVRGGWGRGEGFHHQVKISAW